MGNFHPEGAGRSSMRSTIYSSPAMNQRRSSPYLNLYLLKEPKSRVTLFYGNRDTGSIIFRQHLNDWAAKSGNRLKVVHILDKEETGWNRIHRLCGQRSIWR
jgi:hypothetical protein